MMRIIRRLMRNDHGATAPEYVVITAMVAIACIGSVQALGNAMDTMFSNITQSVEGQQAPPALKLPPAGKPPPPAKP